MAHWQRAFRILGMLVAAAMMASPVRAQNTAAGSGDRQVTFTKDVAPILQRSCQACHRPGMMAPMSLLTYQDARPWSRAIKTKVASREMPPWFIDKHVAIQKYKNDPTLSDEEIETIVKCVDQAAPQGGPADMPPPRQVGDVNELDIPAGQVVRNDGYFRLPKPALISAFQPHMHMRGKAQCLEAIYPDIRADSARPGPARTETLSCVSNFNFDWSVTYPYADDVAPLLPVGTIIHVISWHDNTSANKTK